MKPINFKEIIEYYQKLIIPIIMEVYSQFEYRDDVVYVPKHGLYNSIGEIVQRIFPEHDLDDNEPVYEFLRISAIIEIVFIIVRRSYTIYVLPNHLSSIFCHDFTEWYNEVY